MKKHIILLFIFGLSLSTFAQDSVKIRSKEYYLTLANFSPLTLQLKYKQQIGKKTYFKIGLVNLSASGNSQENSSPIYFPTYNSAYSAGLEVGIEFRKQLTTKFQVYHGPNISFSYRHSSSRLTDPAIPRSQQKNISESYKGSLPYSLGILFNINSNILISAELNPNITYSYLYYKNGQEPQSNRISQHISIGLDNRVVLVSLVYRR
ncbi:MAG: hypothetical protein HYX39_01465 [Bacteroidetes bacterium]|nr:hypothetical protein [Bacteroidota bacterium]